MKIKQFRAIVIWVSGALFFLSACETSQRDAVDQVGQPRVGMTKPMQSELLDSTSLKTQHAPVTQANEADRGYATSQPFKTQTNLEKTLTKAEMEMMILDSFVSFKASRESRIRGQAWQLTLLLLVQYHASGDVKIHKSTIEEILGPADQYFRDEEGRFMVMTYHVWTGENVVRHMFIMDYLKRVKRWHYEIRKDPFQVGKEAQTQAAKIRSDKSGS